MKLFKFPDLSEKNPFFSKFHAFCAFLKCFIQQFHIGLKGMHIQKTSEPQNATSVHTVEQRIYLKPKIFRRHLNMKLAV